METSKPVEETRCNHTSTGEAGRFGEAGVYGRWSGQDDTLYAKYNG